MQASTIFTIFSVLAASAYAQDRQCHVRLTNQAGQTGCFNFGRSGFVANTVFPIFGSCSVQASPEGGLNSCAGLVNGVSPACGTGRDITFADGLC